MKKALLLFTFFAQAAFDVAGGAVPIRLAVFSAMSVDACTGFYVGRKVSANGGFMILKSKGSAK